ncbi:MAG: NAD-dependent epimerase/dehydratase family protein [Acetobacteraceae bacterium]
MTQRFLVTGGAGYVGSHLVDRLVQAAPRSSRWMICGRVIAPHCRRGVRLVEANVSDAAALDAVLAEGPWHAVFHFAALSLVGESMRQPMRYLQENGGGGFTLIDACVRHGVERFVLSSTANLFGEPKRVPIDEDAAIAPARPMARAS